MAFTYKLELRTPPPANLKTPSAQSKEGTPAGDYTTAVPNWKAGDTIPLGAGRSLRVVEVREGVLVVAATQSA